MDLSSSSTNSEELPSELLSLPDAHDGHFEVFVGKEDFKVCFSFARSPHYRHHACAHEP